MRGAGRTQKHYQERRRKGAKALTKVRMIMNMRCTRTSKSLLKESHEDLRTDLCKDLGGLSARLPNLLRSNVMSYSMTVQRGWRYDATTAEAVADTSSGRLAEIQVSFILAA